MPTPQWFQENPKVSTYIPRELHNALEAWMKERQIKKVSQALIKILEIQLGFNNDTRGEGFAQYATVDQLEELRNEIKSFIEKLEQSRIEEPKRPIAKADQLELIKEKKPGQAISLKSEWITGKQAYELYGHGVTLKTFNSYTAEKLQKTFGLEADLSRRTPGGPPSKWIRKP